jgi:hypothetical protein
MARKGRPSPTRQRACTWGRHQPNLVKGGTFNGVAAADPIQPWTQSVQQPPPLPRLPAFLLVETILACQACEDRADIRTAESASGRLDEKKQRLGLGGQQFDSGADAHDKSGQLQQDMRLLQETSRDRSTVEMVAG